MAIKYEQGMYKDIPSVVVTTGKLKAVFLPSQGGKLVSLVLTETGRDYMAQRKGKTYRKLGLDTGYTKAECSAYDDMFPTIDPWSYPDGPLKGLKYLDHGEVARMPSVFTKQGECIHTFMRSTILPYTFERCIRENARGGLRIDFTATNTGDADMDFIWAAHFMACAEAGGEVISPFAPGDGAEIVFADDPVRYGRRGDKVILPYGVDGKTRLDRNNRHDPENGVAWKFYYSQRVPEGYLGYHYPSDGTRLMFAFDKEAVPYAGVWMNDGGGDLGEFHNAALEICTGSFDRPDTARARGQYSVLRANSQYQWYMEIDIFK